MITIIAGIFLILHGFVHLLYAGQSWRLFELRSGMVWPDGAWAFSRLFRSKTTRLVASLSLVLVALGFLAGGLGLIIGQSWWRLVTACSAVFSAAIFLLFWDGKFQALDDQGGIGLLITLAILVIVQILKWPF